MQAMSRGLGLALEAIGGALLVALTALVTGAATLRYFGHGLAWYDEVAPILLAWVTYFGAALVALKRGHLGFDNVMRRLPERPRMVAFVFAEVLTVTFFLMLAWGGFRLLGIVADEALMTLPWFPSALAQSAIPIASVAFVAAELLTLPQAWRRLMPASSDPATASHLT
jgi:TRAP-type C4-dicarboxylate transport system permease small subunit